MSEQWKKEKRWRLTFAECTLNPSGSRPPAAAALRPPGRGGLALAAALLLAVLPWHWG